MPLLDSGWSEEDLDPQVSRALGARGARLLAEATLHGHARIELRDWLYCLARAHGTRAHQALILGPGRRPEEFVNGVESAYDEPDGFEPPPLEVRRGTLAPEVVVMLDRAESLGSASKDAAGGRGFRITDAALTLALLEGDDPILRDQLVAWHQAEALDRLRARLRIELVGHASNREFLREDGSVEIKAFDPSGRRACRRLVEDGASLGAPRITSRHLLYTLLEAESGPLPIVLSSYGLDVKADLHARLARELARGGRKRNEALDFTEASLHNPVLKVLQQSVVLARQRGAAGASEYDIHHAYATGQFAEIKRLIPPGHSLDEAGFRDRVEGLIPAEDEADRDAEEGPPSLQQIEARMRGRIRGQDGAIAKVLPWIKRLRFGLPRDDRPAAVFLFLGPTGTGKTQLAKELARHVFGDEEKLIFLEMGQFQDQYSMSIFVGAPPGYKGYGDGKLTNGLREKPESVVLFDEIEKAYTGVFDVILRFADEGMISDPAGPVRDGRKCLLVMTTNAGQRWLRDRVKADPRVLDEPEILAEQLYVEALRELMEERGFRPEFLGRVDTCATFLPLSEATCEEIVRQILDREVERFRTLKSVRIEVEEPVYKALARAAFLRSLDEGARAVPRLVNDEIVSRVIDALVARNYDPEVDDPPTLRAVLRPSEGIVIRFSDRSDS